MKTCLITAVNRGIGLELVNAALANGWNVIGSVRSQEAAQTTTETFGNRIKVIQFDVKDLSQITSAATSLNTGIDLLINNAGVIGPKRQMPLDMDFEGFSETLSVNTLGPLAVAQAFLPHLRMEKPGKILTVSSQMSWMGYRKPDTLAYRASKAAVNKVMQGLATELEPDNIPVVLIDPGWVRTDMGGKEADNDPRDVADGILELAESLTVTDTGKFFKWNGEERPF